MLLSNVLSSNFFIPIIILLGLATLTSVLIKFFKVKFLPIFAVQIVIGLAISSWFNNYMESLNLLTVVEGIYTLGLSMIMFLSGYEVEYDFVEEYKINEQNDCNDCKNKKCRSCKQINIIKVTILLTIFAYATSIVVSIFFNNYIIGNKIIGIILLSLVFASTFAGIVVPIIQDEGVLDTVIGKLLTAVANLSEALSILFLTILMIAIDVNKKCWLVLAMVLILLITFRLFRKYKVGQVLAKVTEGIDHLATRFIIVLILVLVLLSDLAGGEYILGAFLAGIFVRQANFSHEVIHSLTRIIYGVFAPMFFIIVGTKIDIMIFINDTSLLLLVLYLILCLLVVELPMLYLLKWYKWNTVLPSIVLMACTVVVPIAANHINEKYHLYSREFSQALILASLLVCVIGTIIFALEFPFGEYKNKYTEDK